MRSNPDIIPDMGPQLVIKLIEGRAAEFNRKTEVQVFPKQLKKLTTVQ